MMTYGAEMQNQSTGENSAQVEGEIHGEMTSVFHVEAGSDLLRIAEDSKRLSADIVGWLRSLSSDGPGSTG